MWSCTLKLYKYLIPHHTSGLFITVLCQYGLLWFHSILICYDYYPLFWPCCMAYRISCPTRNWTQDMAVKTLSTNHWTARELPLLIFMLMLVSESLVKIVSVSFWQVSLILWVLPYFSKTIYIYQANLVLFVSRSW